jgi:molybdopterin molybdotransferase
MQVEEALRRLLAAAVPLPLEPVSPWEASGRVAAEDVLAPGPVPHFARAAMDGYVCHDSDLAGASPDAAVVLRITGAVHMGQPPGAGPRRGEAWTITTGGPMPDQGDRVLPLEAGRRAADRLYVERPPGPGTNVARPGEDIRTGVRLVAAGARIPAAAAGALAAAGIGRVSVYRRPRIALVATGNELVDPADATDLDPANDATEARAPSRQPSHRSLPRGRVVNSNSIMLAGALCAAGYAAEYRGIVPDCPDQLREVFEGLAKTYDVVLSTGGVSVGGSDAVHRTWLSLGARRIAGRVDLKPGGPFFAGRYGGAWAIGLSGTPVACFAAFHLLALPLLRRLEGQRHCVRPLRRAALSTAFPRASDRMRALWARLDDRGGDIPGVALLTGRPEGTVASLLSANALVLLPAGTPPLPRGSYVAALALDGEEDADDLAATPPLLPPVVVGVIGESGSGKTTVITGLLRLLAADGVRVVAVKHAAHGFALDRPGSDSARMAASGAPVVVLAGPRETVIRMSTGIDEPERAARLAETVAVALWGDRPDLVLIEGFGHAGRPAIQVGPLKPGAPAPEIWAHMPRVSDLDPEQWESELARAAQAVRTRLSR